MAKTPFRLTKANYFSQEANERYMSVSQYKAFSKCEAAALAELRGQYIRPTSTAMLVGSYVDAYFEGTLDAFREEHPELFKKDGSLKADFAHAETIIERMKSDRLTMILQSGRKQVVKTGKIAGIKWKIKIDSLLGKRECAKLIEEFPLTRSIVGFGEGMIVDGKVMKDMCDMYSEELHSFVSFIEAWQYDLQGAVYQAVDGRMLPFVLQVATKEAEPNLGAFHIPNDHLAMKLEEIEEYAPRYDQIKKGLIEPKRCENCDYCRKTKKLIKIDSFMEV